MKDPHVHPSKQANHTSSTLLQQIREGDGLAWERFVVVYSPLLHLWCSRFGLQHVDNENVSQEVFQTVFQSVHSFQKQKETGSFRSWLKTITKHKVMDFYRKQRGEKIGISTGEFHHLEEWEADNSEDEGTVREEQAILLRRAVETCLTGFSQTTRNVFSRLVLDGVSAAVVANEFKISKNAVYIVKCRVLNRLRDEYSDFFELWRIGTENQSEHDHDDNSQAEY